MNEDKEKLLEEVKILIKQALHMLENIKADVKK